MVPRGLSMYRKGRPKKRNKSKANEKKTMNYKEISMLVLRKCADERNDVGKTRRRT